MGAISLCASTLSGAIDHLLGDGRQLTGQLARRGFPYPAIKAAIDHVLGERDEDDEEFEDA